MACPYVGCDKTFTRQFYLKKHLREDHAGGGDPEAGNVSVEAGDIGARSSSAGAPSAGRIGAAAESSEL